MQNGDYETWRNESLNGESWPTAAIPMDNPYCSCKLTRVRLAGEPFAYSGSWRLPQKGTLVLDFSSTNKPSKRAASISEEALLDLMRYGCEAAFNLVRNVQEGKADLSAEPASPKAGKKGKKGKGKGKGKKGKGKGKGKGDGKGKGKGKKKKPMEKWNPCWVPPFPDPDAGQWLPGTISNIGRSTVTVALGMGRTVHLQTPSPLF